MQEYGSSDAVKCARVVSRALFGTKGFFPPFAWGAFSPPLCAFDSFLRLKIKHLDNSSYYVRCEMYFWTDKIAEW